MTFPDMPEKQVLATIVVWSLSKCAGTGDSATAIVEPITSDAPIRSIGHSNSSVRVASVGLASL